MGKRVQETGNSSLGKTHLPKFVSEICVCGYHAEKGKIGGGPIYELKGNAKLSYYVIPNVTSSDFATDNFHRL